VRQLILTLALPATLFIWFITAFIADGASFRNLRNTDGGSRIYVQPKDFHNVPLEAPAEKKDKKLD
jgi:cytochrome c oxidase subunit IV